MAQVFFDLGLPTDVRRAEGSSLELPQGQLRLPEQVQCPISTGQAVQWGGGLHVEFLDGGIGTIFESQIRSAVFSKEWGRFPLRWRFRVLLQTRRERSRAYGSSAALLVISGAGVSPKPCSAF